MRRSKMVRLSVDHGDESAPSGRVLAGKGQVVDDNHGQALPQFQGDVPARKDVVADRPVFLPSRRDKPVLAFRGHLHYPYPSSSVHGPFHWRCIRFKNKMTKNNRCPGVITTQEPYPRLLDIVDSDFGFRVPHTCGTTHRDVLEYRDKRAREYNKRKRSTGPTYRVPEQPRSGR